MCSDVAVILVARAASGATGRANVGVDDDTGNNDWFYQHARDRGWKNLGF